MRYYIKYGGETQIKTRKWIDAAKCALRLKETHCIDRDDYLLIQILEYTFWHRVYNKYILPVRLSFFRNLSKDYYVNYILHGTRFLEHCNIYLWSELKGEFILMGNKK